MRQRLLSCVVALIATGVLCAGATAATSYTVSLKVPKTVAPGHSFKVKASGTSGSTSRLTVFLAHKSCSASAKAEAATPSVQEIINKNVANGYTSSKTANAGKAGNYHACAYLTGGGHTRAHAAAGYFVGNLTGGYGA